MSPVSEQIPLSARVQALRLAQISTRRDLAERVGVVPETMNVVEC
jgi:DNA-binding XRE family transcriptional regulator